MTQTTGWPVAPFARNRLIAVFAAVGGTVAFLPQSQAGGFALVEHGASGMGNAYAGAAAVAHDASTIWFNPAGMSELDGREIGLGFHILKSNTEWDDEGTSLNASFGGGPVSGPDDASPGTTAFLPNFYYSAPINAQWRYGLGIGAPYGSSTEYEDDWKGRYTTLESGISVIDINPSVSYRVSDKVRLGGGISIQLLSADLQTGIDSSAACFGSVGAVEPVACIDAGLADFGNQELDSRGKISGDSTAVSFNIGALFIPREDTRIGVAYRHGASHEADVDGDFTVNGTLAAVLGSDTPGAFLSDSGASAKIDLPATFMVSVAHELNDDIELLADLTWTGWSSFEELRVEYDNPIQPDTLSLQEWEDVIRLSAGINYSLNDKLILRGGLAFDEEAIPSPERRTARIPGNDRTWVAFGAGYDVNDNITLDVGYTHLFLPETAIDNTAEESPGASTVRGEFDSSVDIFSAQFTWHFN